MKGDGDEKIPFWVGMTCFRPQHDHGGNKATAGAQDRFDLPEPYLSWEKSYLKEFPELQKFLESMIATTIAQLQSPSEDILHNRVCSTLAYEMSKELPPEKRRLAIATDILHNISKEEKGAVLADPQVFKQATEMVMELKKAGYFRSSPDCWGDPLALQNTKVGVLEGEGAIGAYRKLMGATNYKVAEEGTIRRDFATDIGKNVVHGSDSPETAAFETRYFFGEL